MSLDLISVQFKHDFDLSVLGKEANDFQSMADFVLHEHNHNEEAFRGFLEKKKGSFNFDYINQGNKELNDSFQAFYSYRGSLNKKAYELKLYRKDIENNLLFKYIIQFILEQKIEEFLQYRKKQEELFNTELNDNAFDIFNIEVSESAEEGAENNAIPGLPEEDSIKTQDETKETLEALSSPSSEEKNNDYYINQWTSGKINNKDFLNHNLIYLQEIEKQLRIIIRDKKRISTEELIPLTDILETANRNIYLIQQQYSRIGTSKSTKKKRTSSENGKKGGRLPKAISILKTEALEKQIKYGTFSAQYKEADSKYQSALEEWRKQRGNK